MVQLLFLFCIWIESSKCLFKCDRSGVKALKLIQIKWCSPKIHILKSLSVQIFSIGALFWICEIVSGSPRDARQKLRLLVFDVPFVLYQNIITLFLEYLCQGNTHLKSFIVYLTGDKEGNNNGFGFGGCISPTLLASLFEKKVSLRESCP